MLEAAARREAAAASDPPTLWVMASRSRHADWYAPRPQGAATQGSGAARHGVLGEVLAADPEALRRLAAQPGALRFERTPPSTDRADAAAS